jgi:hypothetical protein
MIPFLVITIREVSNAAGDFAAFSLGHHDDKFNGWICEA